MNWNESNKSNDGLTNLDPPFSNPADEYASIAEYLEELAEQEENEENPKPNYHLLKEIPLEDLPF